MLLSYQYNILVYCIVYLLRNEADRKELDGHIEYVTPDGNRYFDFNNHVVRVWELPVELILNSGIGDLPLALIANVKKDELPGLVRRIQERVDVELKTDGRDQFWTTTYLLLGLNSPMEFGENLLKGNDYIRDSTTYMSILDEGIEKGEEIGEEKAFRNTILRLGGQRFGEPRPEINQKLAAIHLTKTLVTLICRLLQVKTCDEFFAPLA